MKKIKRLILIFGRWLAKIAKRMGVGSSQRQILFVGESQLMLAYMKELWQRLKDDDRLSLRVDSDCDIIFTTNLKSKTEEEKMSCLYWTHSIS